MEENQTTQVTEETTKEAAEAAEAVRSETAAEKKADTKKPQEEKVIPQSELDGIIEKRLKRERAASDEKMQKAMQEINSLKSRNICYRIGIRDDAVDDVIVLAERLVDDKTDLAAAIARVAEKYPAFSKSASSATTGVRTENTQSKNDDALRAAFGLKPHNKN